MGYAKILVGVDGSDTSLQAVRYAARLAKLEGASLTATFAHNLSGADAESASEKVFGKARAAAGEEGVEIDTRSERGDPSDVLIGIAEDGEADLLVVGNKGMTGVSRFLLGSVPNRVSHHAPCDLFIVKTT